MALRSANSPWRLKHGVEMACPPRRIGLITKGSCDPESQDPLNVATKLGCRCELGCPKGLHDGQDPICGDSADVLVSKSREHVTLELLQYSSCMTYVGAAGQLCREKGLGASPEGHRLGDDSATCGSCGPTLESWVGASADLFAESAGLVPCYLQGDGWESPEAELTTSLTGCDAKQPRPGAGARDL